MDVTHVEWTSRLTSRPLFQPFRKWFKPANGFNFHVMVRPKNGAGRASMFLLVPHAELKEFLDLVTSVPGYPSAIPQVRRWVYFSVLVFGS